MRQTDMPHYIKLYYAVNYWLLQVAYNFFNWHIFKEMTCCLFLSILQSIPFTFSDNIVPWNLLACPLSNPCIGYPLVRTGLVEPTVSKVVENQKEKVVAVPESILYYTLNFIKD